MVAIWSGPLTRKLNPVNPRPRRCRSWLTACFADPVTALSERPDGSWRARDLAGQLLWSTSRLAHHVGRMEQRGLVARQPCADDARGALISLTGAGWASLHKAAPPYVASVRRHLIDLLTAEEVTALDTIAEKVITHLTGAAPTT